MSVSNFELTVAAQGLPVEVTQPEEVSRYLEAGFEPRLYNPLQDATATERLLNQRELWRDEGATVVLSSGIFDLSHLNHTSALVASRLTAVQTHFANHEADGDHSAWSQLDPQEQKKYTAHILNSGLVKQIVSVDGDLGAEQKKAFLLEKGTKDRPILSWNTRAREMLTKSFATPEGNPRFLADAVSLHDWAVPELAGTAHGNIMEVGIGLQPDVWPIYHESRDLIADILADRDGANLLKYTTAVVMGSSDGLYIDSKLGGPISTTAITKRVEGIGVPA